FLPGPASSQLGIAFGLYRAGYRGALAAWAGFTLPSALFLIAFAYALQTWRISPDTPWLHGLRIAAVAIVTATVWEMAAVHLHGLPRRLIALGATVLVIMWASIAAPVTAILLSGLIGWRFFALGQDLAGVEEPLHFPISKRVSLCCLTLFLTLLLGLPLLNALLQTQATQVAAGFFWAGTFVFDGGPGVLPLLHQTVVPPGWVTNDQFISGFAAAEAMPGPLLTFSGYLGAVMTGGLTGWQGGVFALVATLLPSSLVILSALPFWHHLHRWPGSPGALQGINAAVVGILLAALYAPIWSTAIVAPRDALLAGVGLLLLMVFRLPPIAIVVLMAVVSTLLARW
ncbi:MAG: chromate efflux transporter, partial [Thermomicrobiales bacterium]